jgi:GT2 family glycosyltransferase
VELGIIQVTSAINSDERYKALTDQIIPKCIEVAGGHYTIVSPPNDHLSEYVQSQGGTFIEYTGWEKDKSRKFREALPLRQEEWVVFLDDDILPDDLWLQEMQEFLFDREPGQYGFRLTKPDGTRHQFGEDWMQFPSPKYKLRHRGLDYNIETGYVEQSPTAYVANSVVHRDAYNFIQPFGIFGKSPDVNWCFAIKEAGFAVGFNVKARAYHLGDRGDNR